MAFTSGTDDNDEIGNINITPMVDIMLVLLVIFMVTANFLKKESININLPKVGASDPNVAQSIQVALTRDGKIYLEGTRPRNAACFIADARVEAAPNMRVTLSADERLPYGPSPTMGIRKSGVSRIAPRKAVPAMNGRFARIWRKIDAIGLRACLLCRCWCMRRRIRYTIS